jgi:hypothetical protein
MIFAMGLGLLGRPAAAESLRPPDGRSEAFAVCSGIPFADDRLSCVGMVESAAYLDMGAVKACGTIAFPSSKPGCLLAISNKMYEPAELQACESPFADTKIECLKSTGRAYVPQPVYEPRPDTDGHILRSLRRIQEELRQGRIPSALVDLARLTEFVERGMNR